MTPQIVARISGDREIEIKPKSVRRVISEETAKTMTEMMTAAVKGKTVSEARALFDRFHEVVTGRARVDEPARAEARKALGCLSAFSGVSAYPVRVKCATLAWHAMKQALEAVKGER
jgi:nitrogen fixation NifU-like protein